MTRYIHNTRRAIFVNHVTPAHITEYVCMLSHVHWLYTYFLSYQSWIAINCGRSHSSSEWKKKHCLLIYWNSLVQHWPPNQRTQNSLLLFHSCVRSICTCHMIKPAAAWSQNGLTCTTRQQTPFLVCFCSPCVRAPAAFWQTWLKNVIWHIVL